MRIAFLVHDYHRAGGHSRYVVELAERLCRDHEVHVFAHTVESNDRRRIHFHHVPALRTTALTTILSFPLAASVISRRDFDIVHAQGLCAFRQDVVTAHICTAAWSDSQKSRDGRLNLRQRIFKALVCCWERAIYQPSGSRWVIAVSEKVKNDVARYYGRSERVSVIRPGVDCERFHPNMGGIHRGPVRLTLGCTEEEFLMLYVGDLQKGAAEALRALALLPEAKLLFVSRSRLAAYRLLAEKAGVAERVIFAPPINEVERYYAAADLFLFPTIYDAHGMVIWEAMASGLPVITSRAAGAAEIIEHERDGLLIDDPLDAKKLAEYVRLLIADASLRQQIGARARKKVGSYSWDRVTRETIGIYERVMEMKKP